MYGAFLNEEERPKKFTGESSKIYQAFMARGKYKNYNQGKSYQGNQQRNNQKQRNQPRDNQQRHNFQKQQNEWRNYTNNSRGEKSIKCYNCGENEHKSDHYLKKLYLVVQRKFTQRRQSNFAEEEVDHHIKIASLVSQGNSSDTYYIHWEASQHVTYNKNLFDSLEETKGQNIFLGGDRSHEIKGIGSIPMKGHYGKNLQVTNVNVVPKLTINLLSLNQINQHGYKVEFYSNKW